MEDFMESIDMNSVVDLAFQLKWKSQDAEHTEGYAARDVNLWRDWLPQGVRRSLLGKQAWERSQVNFTANELFGNKNDPLKIDRKRFSMRPHMGRFYPKGRLSGLPGVFPQNMQPFRCTAINNGHMEVDTDHPLASYPLSLSMTIGQVHEKENERGGSSVDWVGLLTDGPGMQARWNNEPTDFFSVNPFKRKDETDDSRFYSAPRLVHHLDVTARDLVSDLYHRFVKDGMNVLDLMSSWTSHLPDKAKPAAVYGLGMNKTELEQNPALTDIRIHDLNSDPELPYESELFDVVVCSVSVEYLSQPLAVFSDVARVLKPEGAFVVTFSNRWFPSKAIGIWEEIHEFERMGLVMEYFLRSGVFANIATYSMRGLPRPKNDKYANELLFSDPVYAVWGRRK
jgi:SAM-dependent methyltransferase/FKBP-type peptidyl-prolyl cis-trans isomerase 2